MPAAPWTPPSTAHVMRCRAHTDCPVLLCADPQCACADHEPADVLPEWPDDHIAAEWPDDWHAP